jgi:hypothetical protein
VINGLPPGSGGSATEAPGNDRLFFGYDTYTDSPAGVIEHYVFRAGIITDIAHTVQIPGDPVSYDIQVNGVTVATIGGGDALATLTGQSIAVAVGDVVTVAPAKSPAPANLPRLGNVQIRIEEV